MSNAEQIRTLREQTGVSVGEIRAALDEARGDVAAALEILRRRGAAIAEQKAGRAVHAGIVETYVHLGGRIGAMAEVLCETDFVALNADFQALAHEIVMQIAAADPKSEAELLEGQFIKDPSQTVADRIQAATLKLGENIRLGRFARFSL
ncbi:elongation factor Ts [Candidatus Parcubacteria bacterium]|nr:elongation factor Ts [Candidatus Parcubacteria bacterium]